MARRRCCEQSAVPLAEVISAVQEQSGEEMTMRRYANPIPVCSDTCGVEQQLEELNQVMDHQNEILAQLLLATRELTSVLQNGT